MDPCHSKDMDCKEHKEIFEEVKRKTIWRNGKKIRIKIIIKEIIITKCCRKPISFCHPRPDITPHCPPSIPPEDCHPKRHID